MEIHFLPQKYCVHHTKLNEQFHSITNGSVTYVHFNCISPYVHRTNTKHTESVAARHQANPLKRRHSFPNARGSQLVVLRMVEFAQQAVHVRRCVAATAKWETKYNVSTHMQMLFIRSKKIESSLLAKLIVARSDTECFRCERY